MRRLVRAAAQALRVWRSRGPINRGTPKPRQSATVSSVAYLSGGLCERPDSLLHDVDDESGRRRMLLIV